ncbi:uncharacterized protein LOC121428628 isoform X1 [Lytechinus variegatus]|uniref:uncharacterized protein LOC121428628 isoform X1 n=1 Tax=Lytechinus variegatus TaxID=7654 RepID=UPI001BB1243C|nr:uncharacterized protein LOC121428628 isoform X1 [Lytechinus variegatus]
MALSTRTRYAIPAPLTGCADNWTPVHLTVSYTNLTTLTQISVEFHLSLIVERDNAHEVNIRFCMWDSESDDSLDAGVPVADGFGQGEAVSYTSLPDGRYCVYGIGNAEVNMEEKRWEWSHGSCPKGFESGFSTFPFNSTAVIPQDFRTNPVPIPTPFSIYTINISMAHYCCAESGDVNTAIELPFVIPFFLFPLKSTECQRVRGMKHRLEHVEWPSMKYHGGAHPYTNNSRFYYCYYEPDTIAMEQNIVIATYTVMIGTPTITFIVLCACRFTHRKLRKRNNANPCWRQRARPQPARHQSSRHDRRQVEMVDDDENDFKTTGFGHEQ